jgi:hypothetical protein
MRRATMTKSFEDDQLEQEYEERTEWEDHSNGDYESFEYDPDEDYEEDMYYDLGPDDEGEREYRAHQDYLSDLYRREFESQEDGP